MREHNKRAKSMGRWRQNKRLRATNIVDHTEDLDSFIPTEMHNYKKCRLTKNNTDNSIPVHNIHTTSTGVTIEDYEDEEVHTTTNNNSNAIELNLNDGNDDENQNSDGEIERYDSDDDSAQHDNSDDLEGIYIFGIFLFIILQIQNEIRRVG